MLAPGARIGGYEIVAPLKSGGMASFHLARRVGPAGFVRPVGIKIVHAHLAEDRAFVEMFLDEARLAARIVHPNVVHTEELGEIDGTFFLAMELVHGVTLALLLGRLSQQRRALSVEVACAIAMKVADGLHAAHEVTDDDGARLEVVHRDVSPQNVLVGADGQVKLIDFGVAKARGRREETRGGELKGKLRYMSPEQAWGRPVDRRTDVYALAVVLWESLTGRRLFGADELATLEQVRAPVIPAPSTLDASVPTAVDDVLRIALAPEREDRFETAQAFRRALGLACPGALAVEPDEIGALVRATVPAELAHERELLGAFRGVAVAPLPTDDAIAERVTHETIASVGDASVAATRVVRPPRDVSPPVPSVAAPPSRRVWPWRVALAVLGVGGLGVIAAVAWSMSRPTDETPPSPCAAIARVDVGETGVVTHAFDTREGTSLFALPGARDPAAPAVRSVALEVRMPGTGTRSLELATANEGTDPRFDTIVGVFHGACDDGLAQRAPDVLFDDLGDHEDYRGGGAVRAEGGEVLTVVISGYGGAVGGRFDEGPGVLTLRVVEDHAPVVAHARVSLVGETLRVEVEGTDDEGDATSVRLRFQGREGSPIAAIDLAASDRPPGAFRAEGTLEVGPVGARAMSGSRSVEVSVLDRGGNASPPIDVSLDEPAPTPDPPPAPVP